MDFNNFDFTNDINHNNFDYNNSHITKPPILDKQLQYAKSTNDLQIYILIDSRDRNLTVSPNNNDFTITLDDPIKNVNSIELISANMPIDIYNITDNNNRIYFINHNNDDFSTIDLYNGNILNKDKIYYIKILPNKYTYTNLVTFLNFNTTANNATNFSYQHQVYKYSDNTIVSNKAYIKVNFNSNKFIFDIYFSPGADGEGDNSTTKTTHDTSNLLIFRSDGYKDISYNIKYKTLPYSANEILGYDINFGFQENSNKLKNFSISNSNPSSNPNIKKDIVDKYYLNNSSSLSIENNSRYNITNYKSIKKLYNLSNVHSNINSNDYVLLHLPDFPRFENKISYCSAVSDAYTKLHLGASTRNIFFGRIKAFTNVYDFNPNITLSKLRLKFTDYYGNLFDFNNSNFTLTFCITYSKVPIHNYI